ncbi:hypothetical protein C1752_01921 [Acaryochloris thomasi RCC1774]|uniref:DUF4351 domain-containing protein n=1 Tax=Acaryochloris thomasi RCC1774 TaxID=1764569 RepID=A0A2W1JJF1_9CYAN|nr:Rpn family recombination-promoting nuclease/putative transposase [Acaryochloris thomasi]PZD73539.1 hypothetical protein C1752_01921 [Acaryochloris thomasi RCC1774]
MYDNTCKFLAETFSSDFATWLLGKPVPLTKLSPSELSLEPIRADALILLESEEHVLHIEFQTEPDATMPYRMADYRLRAFRRFPNKQMKQVVVYLTPTKSRFVHQTVFEIPGTRHEFGVVRLWEQPTQPFLDSPGLLPLAVLTQTLDKTQTLKQVAVQADSIQDKQVQSNVVASAAILAGLSLERSFINQVLRKEIMKQSVIYQDIIDEGRLEGHREGRLEESQSLILRQLNRRVGELPFELRSQLARLSLEQTEALAEALLDFAEQSDLVEWLERQ